MSFFSGNTHCLGVKEHHVYKLLSQKKVCVYLYIYMNGTEEAGEQEEEEEKMMEEMEMMMMEMEMIEMEMMEMEIVEMMGMMEMW